MTRTDRLTGIILALQGRRQTAAQLAERFEVSRRTILRDVDALSQIGVPIVALPGAGGGYGLTDEYWLQPIHLTSAEASALLLAARSLTAHPDGPLAAPGLSAIDKLRAALRPDVLAAAELELGAIEISPPRRAEHLGAFDAVRTAIRDRSWLRVDYQSLRRIATHTILPSSLNQRDGFWYCDAVSAETRERRRYRVDRMTRVEAIPAPADAAEVVAAADLPRRAYDDSSHPEVVIRLSYQGFRHAEDLPHLGGALSQIDANEWELRFRCPPRELDYWARTLFGFGPHAKVLAPPGMRRRIRDLIDLTARQYDDLVHDGDVTVSPSLE